MRKIGKFIRGGATPIQILLAAVFGMMLGLVPGFNMTHVLVIVLLLVLNVSIGIALTCFLISKALLLLLLPLNIHLENLAILHTPIAGLFRWAGDTPVLALMRLEQPGVSGGLAMAVALGLLAGFLLSILVLRIRRLLVKFGDRSERVRKIVSVFPVRFLLWLLFGGQKKPLSQLLTHRAPLLRKWGIVVAAVFVVLVAGGATVAVDYYLAGELSGMLGKANGAEVNIDQTDLSVLRGRVRLVGIQVTDPSKPTHNRFQADEIVADLSIRELLTGRFWLDHVRVPGTPQIDAPRETPGEVYETPEPPPSRNPQDLLWQWLRDPEAIKKFFDRLETAREWLEKIRERMKEKQREPEGPVSEEYLQWLSRNRKEILTKKPAFLIRRLDIQKIKLGDKGLFRVEAMHLSSHPEYNEQSMEIRVGDLTLVEDQLVFGQLQRCFIKFQFQEVDTAHDVDVLVSNLELGKTLKLSDKSPVDFSKGTLTVQAKGTFSAEDMNLPARFLVRDFDLNTRSGREVFGLDPRIFRQVVGQIESLPVVANISGPISRPMVRIDSRETWKALQKSGASGSVFGGLLNSLPGLGSEDRDSGDDEDEDEDREDDSQAPDLRDLIPRF
jgi:hypothetical protein